ncbi:MAG TPA: SH3 domain-containing protein [Pyrinomonadaceae bacterium]|nr:SH3 domain-containing protein [Pyrinomonadaceae bacterium]
MKNKLSITLALAMIFGTIVLPQTASANTFTEWTPITQDNCVVIGDNNLPLRVRATPGGKIIGSLKIGTQILAYNAVQDRNGNYWTKIKFGRRFGYVSTDYVSCG